MAIGKEALLNPDPTRHYAQEKANVTGIEHELPNSGPSHYTSWAINAAMLLERLRTSDKKQVIKKKF